MEIITKLEAEYLKQKGWRGYVKTSSSGKSKKHWVVENPNCLEELKNYRNSHTVMTVEAK